jgi:hypothetical protein
MTEIEMQEVTAGLFADQLKTLLHDIRLDVETLVKSIPVPTRRLLLYALVKDRDTIKTLDANTASWLLDAAAVVSEDTGYGQFADVWRRAVGA